MCERFLGWPSPSTLLSWIVYNHGYQAYYHYILKVPFQPPWPLACLCVQRLNSLEKFGAPAVGGEGMCVGGVRWAVIEASSASVGFCPTSWPSSPLRLKSEQCTAIVILVTLRTNPLLCDCLPTWEAMSFPRGETFPIGLCHPSILCSTWEIFAEWMNKLMSDWVNAWKNARQILILQPGQGNDIWEALSSRPAPSKSSEMCVVVAVIVIFTGFVPQVRRRKMVSLRCQFHELV